MAQWHHHLARIDPMGSDHDAKDERLCYTLADAQQLVGSLLACRSISGYNSCPAEVRRDTKFAVSTLLRQFGDLSMTESSRLPFENPRDCCSTANHDHFED